ncbi:hypothetical protein [Winogradskyella aquimaris]|uniref:CarboxypepD_reg-like domain-containing protein n=1 Tax=Winogradskyella aquimaris TaxID=864074 RepID=A0ABU5EME5_9FLAO|nr:hypothetical protein [Winogradskyella aquimaris]MDY2587620.1 hypothetical protein [Winogradskyella aquimaris]
MRLLFIFILFSTGHYNLSAQTLSGKVYDTKTVVKDMKVLNKTQNRLTVTNDNGDFSIEAKINDTISFQSIFYHPLEVVLKPTHFEGLNVFEVQEIISELDEVELQSEPEQPVFEEETYNQDLHNLIKEDIKRNPELYQSPNAQYGIDFFYLIGQVVKLFKRKKPKEPLYEPLTYKEIDSLFAYDPFFNQQLITENLKIPKDKVKLFFDFCSAKGISSELLKEENKMMLLEELVVNSELFLILLEEYGEEKISKD